VIIPVYDREEELREAIQSIFGQSFKNYELILVCDGSPEPTRSLVDSYADHPQVRIHHFSENSGNACRGRNKGISLAKGRYISFLDSDDISMPYRLERSLFHFLDKKVEIVGGAIEYLVAQGTIRDFENGQRGFTSEECTYELLKDGNRLSICTVTVIREALCCYGGFREEMRYREDHELWLRLAYNGYKFYNSPEVLAKYRIHQDNAELIYLENDSFWFDKALEMHTKHFQLPC